MNIFQSIILGVTEGITEFLPISSSGHLIIVRRLLHLPLIHTLSYDAILQFSATLALIVYFWRDIFRLIQNFFLLISGKQINTQEKILLWAIIVGTIPAVIFGLALESYMDSLFRNVKLVGLMLLLGSALMYSAQRKSSHHEGHTETLTVTKGIMIGLYQCLALLPGVSRSGATISGGLFSKLSRDEAVHFSFLLSIPILFGSGLKELISIRHELAVLSWAPLFWGSVSAFVVGLLSIHYFIRFLKNHNLNLFIFYRTLVFFVIFFLF